MIVVILRPKAAFLLLSYPDRGPSLVFRSEQKENFRNVEREAAIAKDLTVVYESSQNPIFVATPLRFLRCNRRPEERYARRDLLDVLLV